MNIEELEQAKGSIDLLLETARELRNQNEDEDMILLGMYMALSKFHVQELAFLGAMLLLRESDRERSLVPDSK